MIRHLHSLALPAFVCVAVVLHSAPVAAGIKCWTNKDGVRECGNAVPPEYSQQGHERLSDHGIKIEEKERALNDEELAERAEQERLKQEQEAALQQQAREDRILLQTFSSEQDIINSRDDKVAALEATIKLTESRIDKLEEDLNKRMEQAAGLERAGKEPSEELAADIASLQRQVRDNQEFISQSRLEQDRIHKSYNEDIARFRRLKGINAAEAENEPEM